MSGYFSQSNISVQKTETGWTFSKTGKKGSTVYNVTDTNGNGRFDRGDKAKLVKSDLGLFSTQDLNAAQKGVYEQEGNEYSFDEMYGLASIKDTENKKGSYNVSMGSYTGGLGSHFAYSSGGNFMTFRYNNRYPGSANYLQVQRQTPVQTTQGINPYLQLQNELSRLNEFQRQMQPQETNIQKDIYEQIQGYLNDVDENGFSNILTDGNYERLQNIMDETDNDYRNLTDDMANESAELINAGSVPITMIDKMQEVYVDTAEGEQKEKSQKAIYNMINKINKVLDDYKAAPEAEKKNILSDDNYAELTAILIEFDKGDVDKMDEATIKELTQKVVKIMNSGATDIEE